MTILRFIGEGGYPISSCNIARRIGVSAKKEGKFFADIESASVTKMIIVDDKARRK